MKKEPNDDLTREEENMLYWAGLLMLPIGFIGAYVIAEWVVPNFTQAECLFWHFWRAYCPGCGGTRALLALMEGDILLSIWYHPLIMYCVALYVIYMITHTLEKLHVPHVRGMRFRVLYLYGALALLVVNCVIKNVLNFGFGITM